MFLGIKCSVSGKHFLCTKFGRMIFASGQMLYGMHTCTSSLPGTHVMTVYGTLTVSSR